MSIRLIVVCVSAVVIAGCTQSENAKQSDVARAPVLLDTLIQTAMAEWEIPGLAVIVVKNGRTVLMKGYGARVLGTSLPIDAETYLQIASNSKAFTAYAIGMLIDEGKLNWDDPVKKYIPELTLPARLVTEEISIDDLLSHRSGLTELPLGGFQNPDYTVKELLRELENTPLSNRFRARNNYSQVGMALLGEIVQRVSGLSWEEFVRRRIFEPLAMDSSYTSNADFAAKAGVPQDVENIMQPAIRVGETIKVGSWENVGTTPLYAPAGGIISNMKDMSGWIQFRLNDGVRGDQRLISADALNAIRAPRIPADFSAMGMPWSYFHPCAQLLDVGFGQYSFEHRGRKVISHNGGWMSSVIEIMPGEGIGVGIFSNAWFDEPTPWASLAFVNALALDILDYYLGYPVTDWASQMAENVSGHATDQLNAGICGSH